MACWAASTNGCAKNLTAVVFLVLGLCSGGFVKAEECDGIGNQTLVLCIPQIAGIAVGGSVFLLSLVCFCMFICICCYRRKKKKKEFRLINSSEMSINPETGTFQTPLPFVNGTYVDSKPLQTVSGDQVEMDTSKLSVESVLVTFKGSSIPSSLPALTKSFSSHEVSNFQNTASKQQATINPDVLSPGYVPMNSVGSVRMSKSLGNLVSAADELEIYTDPDSIISGLSLLNQANKSSSSKPSVSPKPHQLQSNSASSSKGNMLHSSPQSNSPQKGHSDYYVPSDVFVQDKEEQEAIDSYYNKDTIESIRKAMSHSKAGGQSVDNPALYANFDAPVTPSHMIRTVTPTATPVTQEQKDDYESIEDYIRSSNTTDSSPPPKSNYYSIKDGLDRPTEDNYSEVLTAAERSVNPNITEDDQYVYMKSNTRPPLNVQMLDTSSPQRTQTSPSHSKPLYQNFDHNPKDESSTTPSVQPSDTSSKMLPVSPKEKSAHASPQSNINGMENQVDLYVNVAHNEESEADFYVNVAAHSSKDEELYEVLS